MGVIERIKDRQVTLPGDAKAFACTKIDFKQTAGKRSPKSSLKVSIANDPNHTIILAPAYSIQTLTKGSELTHNEGLWTAATEMSPGKWHLEYRSGSQVCNDSITLDEVKCGADFEERGGECEPVPASFPWKLVIPISLAVLGLVTSLFYLWWVRLPQLLCNRKLRHCKRFMESDGHSLAVVSSKLGSGTEDGAGLYDCIRQPVSRHKYTGFHCAVLRNADMALVRSMLRAAPDLVAIEDSAGKDAVQLAVKYQRSEELVAEMVMRCLQAGCKLNGWHSILENAEHTKYVVAVVSLVQEAAQVKHISAPSPQHTHSTTSLASELGELATPRGMDDMQQTQRLDHMFSTLNSIRPSDTSAVQFALPHLMLAAETSVKSSFLRRSEGSVNTLLPAASCSAPIAEQVTSVEQQAVHQLASALDKRNRHAIDVAALENRTILEDASLYLKRCQTMHVSA